MTEPEELDFSSLHAALRSLENAWSFVRTREWFEEQSPELRETLQAGVIQNFEFVYELSYKMLRRYLESASGGELDLRGEHYRDVLRRGAEAGLIEDVRAWFVFRDLRNISSHTYDHVKASRVLESVPSFLAHAREVARRISS